MSKGEVYSVVIFPSYGHKNWMEMSSFVCSSKENVILVVLEYLKSTYNYEISKEDLKTVLDVSMNYWTSGSISDIFYRVTTENHDSSFGPNPWRIEINKCIIDKYNAFDPI